MNSKKENKAKLGASSLKKNPFLNARGGLDLVEKFPGIDFIPYEKRRIKNQKRDD